MIGTDEHVRFAKTAGVSPWLNALPLPIIDRAAADMSAIVLTKADECAVASAGEDMSAVASAKADGPRRVSPENR